MHFVGINNLSINIFLAPVKTNIPSKRCDKFAFYIMNFEEQYLIIFYELYLQ